MFTANSDRLLANAGRKIEIANGRRAAALVETLRDTNAAPKLWLILTRPDCPMTIQLKRVYARPEASDGARILVERLWPRGLTRVRAALDVWMKEVAPSPDLRKWYGHDIARWPEFQRRYRAELRENAAVAALARICAAGPATFLFAAKDEAHNSAVTLKAFIEAGAS